MTRAALLLLPLIACSTDAPLPGDQVPGTLSLDVSALMPGQALTLSVTGATPGSTVRFFASLAGPGSGPCAPGGVVCLDVRQPIFLPTRQADASGNASLTLTAPGSVNNRVAAFQAVNVGGGFAFKSGVHTRLGGDGDLDLIHNSDDCDDSDPNVGAAETTWLATYTLTGSTFDIVATQNFTITLQEPYTDDLNMGPGTVTVRLADDGGAPADGGMSIVEYHMTQNFVTGIPGLATVTSDLQNDAGPDECGLAAGTSGTWTPAELSDYCQVGTVSCVGLFCGSFGSPPQGSPIILDSCSTLPLGDWTFAADFSSFSSTSAVVSSDANQTTSLTLQGTQTALVSESFCPCP